MRTNKIELCLNIYVNSFQVDRKPRFIFHKQIMTPQPDQTTHKQPDQEPKTMT